MFFIRPKGEKPDTSFEGHCFHPAHCHGRDRKRLPNRRRREEGIARISPIRALHRLLGENGPVPVNVVPVSSGSIDAIIEHLEAVSYGQIWVEATQQVAAESGFSARIAELGAEAAVGTPAEAKAFIKDESIKWQGVIAKTGAKLDERTSRKVARRG